MATDYSKKKNAELEELLKARSLPHSGKKAELVARLQQYDAERASAAAAAKQPASATSTAAAGIGDEDQIDWEEEEGAAAPAVTGSAPAATAAIAAGGQGQIANPTAVPNQVLDTDPSKTDDLSVKPPSSSSAGGGEKSTKTTTTATANKESPTTTTTNATATATTTPAPAPQQPTDFTSGLQASSIDDEIAKRQKRAARFGIQESNDDAMKALARAKKF
ncbi:MAG: hypothetical protein Q9191_002998, partial [Dirinaria sp. TL-2023a]